MATYVNVTNLPPAPPSPQLLYMNLQTPNVADQKYIWVRSIAGGAWVAVNDSGGVISTSADPLGSAGTIAMPLSFAKLAAFGNTAAIGGVLSTNTAPTITERNGATDPGARITWAASSSVAIRLDGTVPNDLNPNVPAVMTVTGLMGGSTDVPVLTAAVFVGIGGANIGAATAAFSNASQALAVTLSAWPASSAGQPFTVTLTPGTHTTDTMLLDAVGLAYTRR